MLVNLTFVSCLVLICIFKNQIKASNPQYCYSQEYQDGAPCCPSVQPTQPPHRARENIPDLRFQSKVGLLVGLLLVRGGWLPMALACGPPVRAERRAGAERWWNAAFC